YPVQYPAALPVIGPIPIGPVPSPPGIVVLLSIKSLSYHLRTTLRAVLGGTRLAPYVGHRRAAIRTDAVAPGPGAPGPAHSAAPATSASAGALSAASRPGPILSWHDLFLSIGRSSETLSVYIM